MLLPPAEYFLEKAQEGCLEGTPACHGWETRPAALPILSHSKILGRSRKKSFDFVNCAAAFTTLLPTVWKFIDDSVPTFRPHPSHRYRTLVNYETGSHYPAYIYFILYLSLLLPIFFKKNKTKEMYRCHSKAIIINLPGLALVSL